MYNQQGFLPAVGYQLSFEGGKSYTWFFSCTRINAPNPCVVQGPSVHTLITVLLHVCCVVLYSLSHVWLFATPWTVAHEAPLSVGFSSQEYWNGLPFLLQGIFTTPVSWTGGWILYHWATFSSVAQSCPTPWDPMDGSMSGLPVHHQLPEFTQTHVHWFSDAIQPSHPLSSPSPPAFNLSDH